MIMNGMRFFAPGTLEAAVDISRRDALLPLMKYRRKKRALQEIVKEGLEGLFTEGLGNAQL